MSQSPDSLQRALQHYHEQHMADGQDCYFTLRNGRLHPQPEQIHWLNAHRRKVRRLLHVQAMDRFVDIGCGEGYLTLPLAAAARDSFAFDFVASALDVLQAQPAYDPSQLLVAIASGDEIPLPAASVDKLLCNHVLEHVIDDDAVMREFHRVLRPGGQVLIGVPLALSPQVRFLIRVRRILRPKARRLRLEQVQPGRLVPELIGVQSHVRFYSMSAVRDLLVRNGFEFLQAEGIGFSMRGGVGKLIRRQRLLFTLATALARIFPGIGDGVLVLGRKR